MKRLTVIALLGALGCFAAGGAKAATTITTSQSTFTFFDGCTGEYVEITGELQSVVTSTSTNNTISGTFHSIFRATGTGLSSGLTYRETVEANRTFQTSLQNGEAVSTFEGLISVVAPGGSNNYTSPIFIHTTMDANGNVTSFKLDPPTIECR